MNGGRKRRIPVNVVVVSLLVLAVSVVTAQQVFNGNGQTTFFRPRPQLQQQPQFQPNRSFILPSASPLRHRNLFTRQISHRHRSRQRFSLRTTTQTSVAPLTRIRVASSLPNNRIRSRSRTKPVTSRANQRTSSIKSNISRRQQQLIPQQRRPLQQQSFAQPRQQFRFQQPPTQQTRVQNLRTQPAFVRSGPVRTFQPVRPPPPSASQFSIRAPLSPIPFGAVQQTGRRLPQNNLRLSLRPPTPPPTPPLLTTTTPLLPSPTTLAPTPSTPDPIQSTGVSQSIRRPIRVQQVSLDLRRKPQMTRGQFRRPHPSSSNQQFPLIRHQPTHRVKPDRVTRPITGTTTSAETTTTTADITTATQGEISQVNHFKQVDDIEAAILQALIDSSSTASPPSSTHRPRRIRPGHRHRTTAPPPRVDSIEEAVLRAVLEATPSTSSPEQLTTIVVGETVEDTTEEPTTTTTVKNEATSLFPAFASRRQTHRRRTTLSPTTTSISTTPEATTTETATVSTEQPTTLPFSTIDTTFVSEEPEMTTEAATSSEDPAAVTIAIPEESIEDPKTDDHQLHQIEQNVIAAISTPTTSPSSLPPTSFPSSPSPFPSSSTSPAPPAPPPPSVSPVSSAGPPGSMPPSDDIVDELNGSSDFLQVAQRLHLLRRLLQ